MSKRSAAATGGDEFDAESRKVLLASQLVESDEDGPMAPAVVKGTMSFAQFRAFDKKTGKLLWETLLPFSGNATPATYSVGGKQYVVIAAGGGKSGAASGGVYVAFALE